MNRLVSFAGGRRSWVWLAGIAAVLRFLNLGVENLWYDETFTARVVNLDWSHMWQAIRGDVHPPLFYLIEALNVRLLGSSEWALRAPSAILGVVGVLLIYRLALDLKLERSTAFLAGLMTAIMPAALYYSQDARMYPLLAVFVLTATIAAIREWWLLMAVASVGAVYTQNLALFYVASLGLGLLLTRGRVWRQMVKPVLALASVGAAWLPWGAVILGQAKTMGSGFWLEPLTAGGALFALPRMTMGVRLSDIFQLSLYGVSFGISFVSLINCRRWLYRRDGLIVFVVAVGTPLLMIAASMLWRNVFLARALLPSTMILMIMWAYTLLHLGRDNALVARGLVIPALLIGLFSHYFTESGRDSIYKHLQPVRDGWRAGDVLFFSAVDTTTLTTYYMPDVPYVVWKDTDDLNHSIVSITKDAFGVPLGTLDQALRLAREHGGRVWWLFATTATTSQAELDLIAVGESLQPTVVFTKDVYGYVLRSSIWLLQ
ncbi:MAG: glycosyltransferase family 39 protein [Anaerolineae bacterium]|nr:glycosyltransferase family 39 protein [Anaerolineae bacterium]